MTNDFSRNGVARLAITCAIACGLPGGVWAGPPSLALVTPGGSAAGASVVEGTASVTLGLRVDTGGEAVGSLLYHVVTDPAGTARYAAAGPVVALGAPFTTADLAAGLAPAPGATVAAGAAGSTLWFKATAGDYAAFAGEIARYTFDTSAMPAGTYAFTPVGEELANDATAPGAIDAFGPAGTFVLTVTAVPEPTSAVTAAALCGAWAASRRVRRRSPVRAR